MLLDDSFHQIKVHPDDMKFFVFITSDGQFEYTRLPFDLEAPASIQKFHKQIVQVLQSLICKDKVFTLTIFGLPQIP